MVLHDTLLDTTSFSGDVFLLDASPKLYLWVGKEASQDEKKQAFTIATSYMKQVRVVIFV